MDTSYFTHKSVGKIVYDFGKGSKLFEPWWAMVLADSAIIKYYAYLLKKQGIVVQKGSAYGAHISIVRGEAPPMLEKWGLCNGEEVEFYYSHHIRTTPYHAWVDVYSDKLNELREKLGYPPKPIKTLNDGRTFERSYHLTIGRM